MIEHKTIEPETKTAIVMSRDAIDALRRVVDLIAGGEGVIRLEPEPEPAAPAWPTARHVWWDGAMWTLNNKKTYLGPGDYWKEPHLDSPPHAIRDEAHRFAREAVPVTIVPTRELERLCASIADDTELRDAVEALITATKTLNGETNA